MGNVVIAQVSRLHYIDESINLIVDYNCIYTREKAVTGIIIIIIIIIITPT